MRRRARNRQRAWITTSNTEVWPRQHPWRLVTQMERYLSVDDTVCGVVGRPHSRLRVGVPLALRPVLEALSDHDLMGPLSTAIDAQQANDLWSLARRKIAELGMEDGIATSDSWQTFVALASVIASNVRYPAIPLARRALAIPWDERQDSLDSFRQRLLRRVGVADLMRASLTTLPLDLQSPAAFAHRVLTRPTVGVCRHYSRALQVLFHACQRATGAHAGTHVIGLSGNHDFRTPVMHAWTWFVDTREDQIVTIDLTAADWEMDRRGAQSVLNPRLTGSHHNNVSAFLATLFDADFDAARTLFARMIRPNTVRGQILLFRLANHDVVQASVRRRIIGFLLSSPLDQALPGWQLTLREAQLKRAFKSGDREHTQHALLDQLRLPAMTV